MNDIEKNAAPEEKMVSSEDVLRLLAPEAVASKRSLFGLLRSLTLVE